MSGVSGTFSKILDFFTNGYESDDPIEQLATEMGAQYPVEDNVARNPEYVTQPIKQSKPKNRDNVVSYPGARGAELLMVEPRSFSEDALSLITYLQEGKVVVVNMHLLDKREAQRLIDFMSGATQALHGTQQKIVDTAFIFAPTGVSISADTLKSKTSISDGIWTQRQY